MKLLSKREIIGLLTIVLLIGVVVIGGRVTSDKGDNIEQVEQVQPEVQVESNIVADSTKYHLKSFDPNTVSYHALTSFGLTRREALAIIRFREAGKVYRFREDILSCRDVSDSLYARLEPYIVIGEEFQYQPKQYNNTRDTTQRKSYTTKPKPSFTPTKVDINSADSAALRPVFGIGAKSAAAIVEYRNRLGGFYSIEQLTEIDVIMESNYEKIIEQISLNNYDISKIDVNFAAAKELSHPYISNRAMRRLLKYRELKGGWSSVEEMIEDNIFTEEEALKLRPYLEFTLPESK